MIKSLSTFRCASSGVFGHHPYHRNPTWTSRQRQILPDSDFRVWQRFLEYSGGLVHANKASASSL